MHDSFDIFEYIDFLRARWKFAAIACGVAISLAIATGFLLPRRYTATATILIRPSGRRRSAHRHCREHGLSGIVENV